MTGPFRLLCISVVAVPFTQAYADEHKGPPDVTVSGIVQAEVVNTVDTSVVNTVDTRVVNTISAAQLEGTNFNGGVTSGGSIILVRAVPFKLRAISTSIAPDVAGDRCTVSVSIGEGEGTPIGFSLMSMGEAGNLSQHYDMPIDAVSIIQWDVGGDAAFCNVTLAVSGEVDAEVATLQQRSTEPSVRVEVR